VLADLKQALDDDQEGRCESNAATSAAIAQHEAEVAEQEDIAQAGKESAEEDEDGYEEMSSMSTGASDEPEVCRVYSVTLVDLHLNSEIDVTIYRASRRGGWQNEGSHRSSKYPGTSGTTVTKEWLFIYHDCRIYVYIYAYNYSCLPRVRNTDRRS
jgi:hypothetical protein